MVTHAERSNPANARTWTLARGSSWLGAGVPGSIVPSSKTKVSKVSKVSKLSKDSPVLRVGPRHWLCEACLWTDWHYLGYAVAGTCTSLLCLSPEKLLAISAGHAELSAELMLGC